MASYRQTRINEELTHVLAEAVRESKDPRLQKAFVSITDVNCAKDMKTANVYFSYLLKEYSEKEIRNALKGASGYLRTYIAQKVNLRETPVLNFIYDDSIERGNRISAILSEINAHSSTGEGSMSEDGEPGDKES